MIYKYENQKDKLTAQEKRLFQDVDNVRDVHSNGLPPKEDDERKDWT